MAQKKVTAVQLALLKKFEAAIDSGRVLTAKERATYRSILDQMK